MLARPAEEESDAEVRREDQDRINKFAGLNAKLQEIQSERAFLKRELEGLDDASTELMMGTGDTVLLLFGGEAFCETTEDDAVQFCEGQVEKLQATVDKLVEEEAAIVAEQAELKKILYARFGKSINLESS